MRNLKTQIYWYWSTSGKTPPSKT